MKQSVMLVTTTSSPRLEDLRFQLALKTCEAARLSNYDIAVVDASPDEAMRDKLRARGAIVEKEAVPGMGASRRQAIRMALTRGAGIVVWLEPEKYPLVPLLGPCIDLIQQGADIVVPRRRNLDGYPEYQQKTEYAANWDMANVTGRYDLDLMIGPRVLSANGARLFLCYDEVKPEEDRWELLFVPVVWAIKRGCDIRSCVVPYVHPPEQTAAEQDNDAMNRKRDEQRIALVNAVSRAMAGEALK